VPFFVAAVFSHVGAAGDISLHLEGAGCHDALQLPEFISTCRRSRLGDSSWATKISNLAAKPRVRGKFCGSDVFVLNAFSYYLHYNQAAFTDPNQGAASYWVMRGWLLMHNWRHDRPAHRPWCSGPASARYARLHRWTRPPVFVRVAVARWVRSV
jgi:hypothetical protein